MFSVRANKGLAVPNLGCLSKTKMPRNEWLQIKTGSKNVKIFNVASTEKRLYEILAKK